MNERELRKEMSAISSALWNAGFVANHDGNLSVRVGRGRLLCTPTGISKRSVTPEAILGIDQDGKVTWGSGKPFSEINLHLAYYREREDISAVIHAHPPTATGVGVSYGFLLEEPFLPEVVVSLGASIPRVPLAMPGDEALRSLEPYIRDYDAVLIEGNGVLTCGQTLEQAYLRMELVEHVSKIALVAHNLGGIRPLPEGFLPPLLSARSRAGLGAKRSSSSDREKTLESTPHPSRSSPEFPPDRLRRIVGEEIQRVLK